jgi:hypothetical protein
MMLFRRNRRSAVRRSAGLLEDLEALGRRLRALPIVGVVLIAGGFGAGNITTRFLDLPEDRPVRVASSEHIPQIYLESLSRVMAQVRSAGDETVEYVSLYREHIEPVEQTLIKRGIPAATARRVAWPLVQHSYRNRLDPATVLAVMMVESGGRPHVTSFVGARGLMQVMPFWAGHWRSCGTDLYDIDANLCHGTNILAYYYSRNNGDERRALLGYNGCVRGTNTPNCHTYPDKVASIRRQFDRELQLARGSAPTGSGASNPSSATSSIGAFGSATGVPAP